MTHGSTNYWAVWCYGREGLSLRVGHYNVIGRRGLSLRVGQYSVMRRRGMLTKQRVGQSTVLWEGGGYH